MIARAAIAAVALLLLLPVAARAQTLSTNAPASLPFSMTLNGTDQTLSSPVPGFTVTDTRSAPTAGWKLTAAVTAFSTPGGRTMPADWLTVLGFSNACSSGCSSAPVNTVTYPISLSAGAGAVKVYNAAANTGRGTYTVTPTLRFILPANAYTGTYSATLTTAVVSGP